jgi:hypothetical protein
MGFKKKIRDSRAGNLILSDSYRTNHLITLCLIALSGIALALTGILSSIGITLNQSLALVFSLSILTVWFYDKFKSVTLGLFLFISKPFWVRFSFMFDYGQSGNGGFDLLGIMPAILFSLLIILQIYSNLAGGPKICRDRTRILLMIFAGLSFISIFFPTNSITIGLGGFERNILPNMMILFLLADIVTEKSQILSLVKTLLVVGLISLIYGIGQYFAGIYHWELDWFQQIAFKDGFAGWLTIGLRGIEFRLFSIFYSYMDFFFTNILIYALIIAFKNSFDGIWCKLRTIYLILFYAVLILSLERMPLVMALIVTLVLHYLGRSARQKRKIIWMGLVSAGIIYSALLLATPLLNSMGAAKLVRLAELANPFKASSINDRVQTKWGPAIETIKSNPIGVGIGFGSQTKASGEAKESNNYVQPHNELIQKALETSFVGAILYLLLLIYLFKDFKIISKFEYSDRLFGYAMIAGTIAFWICGLVNLPFSGTSGLVYWALAGAALAIKDRHVSNWNIAKFVDDASDNNGGLKIQNETSNRV